MTTHLAARETLGTRFELVLRGEDRFQLEAIAEEALDEVERLDARWSVFRPDSELAEINRRAARESVQVDALLMGVLVRARGLWQATGGAFDPALGGLMEDWGFRTPSGAGASMPVPKHSPARAGMGQVVLDPQRRQVRFLNPTVQLDLGAIGKGFAVDCAVELCREAGVGSGLVHAGTSSVFAFGEAAPGVPWQIGVPTVAAARQGRVGSELQQHEHEIPLLTRITLRDRALGLSAPWGRERTSGDRRVGHILDPKYGRPAMGVAMAVVVAERAEEADALATALVVGGAPLQARLAARPSWQSLVVLTPDDSDAPHVISSGLELSG